MSHIDRQNPRSRAVARGRTPLHLWIVGGVSLLWNAGAAYDYLMTKLGSDAYLAALTETQRAYIAAFPPWVEVAWFLGVWCAVAGSILLLARLRYAVPAFAVSILGVLGTAIYGEFGTEPPARVLMGGAQLWFSAAILASLVALLVYAAAMRRRGWLR